MKQERVIKQEPLDVFFRAYYTPRNDRRLGWFINVFSMITGQWWLVGPLTVYLLWAGWRGKRLQRKTGDMNK